ncbi:MAG: pentapeptide repeat-containing protein [Rhodococcus sp. (in: high G+C Gram-positive bacteria)]|nr:MAG: pentapeptide repeat-containing protein [Rhodococcus sp. (in: high G+C Gram-positive bacteria)]
MQRKQARTKQRHATRYGVAVGGSVTAAPVASADIGIGTCTIVDNPTPATHTVCPGADLNNAGLSGRDLSYPELSGASFVGANLSGANLTEADLTGAVLGQDVGITDLSGANLTGADFTRTVLSPGDQTAQADQGGTATVSWVIPRWHLAIPSRSDPVPLCREVCSRWERRGSRAA